ncbi:MAG: hypothetical protein R2849_10650 [Thermomicrobiales bacterium]
MFHLDLGNMDSPRDRWRYGRALAASLKAIEGFVAFLAIEAADGSAAGLCICVDAASLETARQVAQEWQREHGDQAPSNIQALVTGEVIVQQGF